jgi:two-component system sensor histidine kinase KdpD
LLDDVVRGSGDIDVYVISGDTGQAEPKLAVKSVPQKTDITGWLLSTGIVTACTGIAALMFPYFNLVDIAMVYLLGIMIVSSSTGKAHFWRLSLAWLPLISFLFLLTIHLRSIRSVIM